MAEDKKSFVLYSDQRSIIEMLPDDKAGILLKHIFAYVNDENPINNDPLVLLAFEPIKLQMKRDLIKWLATKGVRSTAGKASAEARRLLKESQQNSTNLTNVDFVQQSSTNPTVNVTVNDNVTVNEINNNKAQTLLTVNFLNWFNEMKFKHKGIKGNFKTLTKTDIANLKELKKANYTPEDFEHAYKVMVDSEWVKINSTDTPKHFLINTNFSKYVNTVVSEQSKFNPYG